jgi:SPP1 family predicted phage head-tail adaptor
MPLRRLSTGIAYENVGGMNNRVQILSGDLSRTTGGEFSAASLIATVWASVRALTGRELATAQQLAALVTHEVVIRYRSDVKQNDQLELTDGRTFRVEYVADPDERKFDLRLLCVEPPQEAS